MNAPPLDLYGTEPKKVLDCKNFRNDCSAFMGSHLSDTFWERFRYFICCSKRLGTLCGFLGNGRQSIGRIGFLSNKLIASRLNLSAFGGEVVPLICNPEIGPPKVVRLLSGIRRPNGKMKTVAGIPVIRDSKLHLLFFGWCALIGFGALMLYGYINPQASYLENNQIICMEPSAFTSNPRVGSIFILAGVLTFLKWKFLLRQKRL